MEEDTCLLKTIIFGIYVRFPGGVGRKCWDVDLSDIRRESRCPKDLGSGKLEVGEDKRKFGEIDGNDENKMPLIFPKKAYADLSEMLGNGKSTSML